MSTISWSDVNNIDGPGHVIVQDIMISIEEEQISRWKDDPDGRFLLAITSEASKQKTARLIKFYPSL